MNCPNCGAELMVGSLFCDNCGFDVKDLAAAPPAPPPDLAAQVDAADAGLAADVGLAAIAAVDAVAAADAVAVAAVVAAAEPAAAMNAFADAGPAAPPPSAAPRPRVVIKDTGVELPLAAGRQLLIGRADPTENHMPDLDLTDYDKQTGVSRRHAFVHEQAGSWYLRDLTSTNYTFLNRQKLTPEQDYVLEDGDEIRFARVVAVFKAA